MPWAAVGFIVGAAAGLAWGKKAKSSIGQAVTTEFDGGVATVRFDTVEAARAGLNDHLNAFIDRW